MAIRKRVDSWVVTDDFWERVVPLIPARERPASKDACPQARCRAATPPSTSRPMAPRIGPRVSWQLSLAMIRIWAKHGIKPHRLERHLASNDPDFEAKAADVIGLYLHPPQHAAVFSVDKKTPIQALDSKDLVLPLSPRRAERHGFEYLRHSTLSLYATFNTKTGEVLGKTAARHTSAELVSVLNDIVANQPRGKEFVSLPTTSRRTRPSRSARSWPRSRRFTCASRQPTRPGSIRLSRGSLRLNAM